MLPPVSNTAFSSLLILIVGDKNYDTGVTVVDKAYIAEKGLLTK